MKSVLTCLFLISSVVIGGNIASIIFFSVLQDAKIELPTPN